MEKWCVNREWMVKWFVDKEVVAAKRILSGWIIDGWFVDGSVIDISF